MSKATSKGGVGGPLGDSLVGSTTPAVGGTLAVGGLTYRAVDGAPAWVRARCHLGVEHAESSNPGKAEQHELKFVHDVGLRKGQCV